MTTERSSFQDPGGEPGGAGDDALGNVDALVGTREDEMTSTGLSDAAYPSGASTSKPATGKGSRDTAWASGSKGSTSSSGSSDDKVQSAASGVADRVADTAQQQVGSAANSQLSKASDMLDQVAEAVRQSGEQMRQDQPQIAGLADTAAQQVDKASGFLRQTDFNGLVREAEDFARRQPAVFLGGALALGLVASRFLKASPQGGQSGDSDSSGSRYGSGSYSGSYRGGSYGSGYNRGSTYGGGYSGESAAGGYGGGSGYMSGSPASGAMNTDEGEEHGRV